jgi:hypothetical protein
MLTAMDEAVGNVQGAQPAKVKELQPAYDI